MASPGLLAPKVTLGSETVRGEVPARPRSAEGGPGEFAPVETISILLKMKRKTACSEWKQTVSRFKSG